MKLQFIDQLRSGCWTFPICMRLRFFGAAWGYSPWIHSENGDFTITLLNGFVQKGGYHQNCNFTWKNWMMPTLTDHQISGSKIGCTPDFQNFLRQTVLKDSLLTSLTSFLLVPGIGWWSMVKYSQLSRTSSETQGENCSSLGDATRRPTPN